VVSLFNLEAILSVLVPPNVGAPTSRMISAREIAFVRIQLVDSQDTRSIGVYSRSSRDELSLALCPLNKSLIIQAVSHFSPRFSPRTRGIDRLIPLAPFYLSLPIKTRATYVRKRDDLRGGSL